MHPDFPSIRQGRGPHVEYLWHTFLGGATEDYGWDVAVDTAGNIYLAGYVGGF